MKYKRLNFEDYFTICSDNWNKKETDLEMAVYKEVPYQTQGRPPCPHPCSRDHWR